MIITIKCRADRVCCCPWIFGVNRYVNETAPVHILDSCREVHVRGLAAPPRRYFAIDASQLKGRPLLGCVLMYGSTWHHAAASMLQMSETDFAALRRCSQSRMATPWTTGSSDFSSYTHVLINTGLLVLSSDGGAFSKGRCDTRGERPSLSTRRFGEEKKLHRSITSSSST